MNQGRVPGAMVSDALLRRVEREWHDRDDGRKAAIDRAAKTAAVLKGMGYRGIHIGGIHRDFEMAGRILDRLKVYEHQWRDLAPDVHFPQAGSTYTFPKNEDAPQFGSRKPSLGLADRIHFDLLSRFHDLFFNSDHALAPFWRRVGSWLDGTVGARLLKDVVEDPAKKMLLDCQSCGDCAIQHVGFLCPESKCPKHMRNGACGGSCNGRCEVYPDRTCVWVRAYERLARNGRTEEMIRGCIPPRMWELNQSSAWLNFHLKRDHQSSSCAIARRCRLHSCRIA
jgi:methylenetetrahydrofolate reductase (NADPH)